MDVVGRLLNNQIIVRIVFHRDGVINGELLVKPNGRRTVGIVAFEISSAPTIPTTAISYMRFVADLRNRLFISWGKIDTGLCFDEQLVALYYPRGTFGHPLFMTEVNPELLHVLSLLLLELCHLADVAHDGEKELSQTMVSRLDGYIKEKKKAAAIYMCA